MDMVELIAKKRRGESHTPEELRGMIRSYVSGDIPDYQMAAWMMAVCFQGMAPEETGTLMWTDPETNTAFFLEGALGRFDLLGMATHIAEMEPQLLPPVKRAAFQSGTAGSGT